MRIGITGPNGYIGSALVHAGAVPLNCDVTKMEDVEKEVNKQKPDMIFHLAAKSNIGHCERNPDETWFVNCLGTMNVAEIALKYKIPSATLSSYQIWHGGLLEQHKENSKITPARNRYGMSKVGAEAIASDYGMKVIRTSYVFDRFRLMNKLDILQNEEMSIVEPAFLFRSFIYLKHFVDLAQTYFVNYDRMPSVLHLAGSDTVSWFNFMLALCKVYDINPKMVHPRYFEDRNQYPRPWNGKLDISKSLSLGLPSYDYKLGLLAMHREQK